MHCQAFKDGDVRLLICTDVAARGIDISGLPFMVNMTLPDKSEDYIHRVGRVGEVGHPLNVIEHVDLVMNHFGHCCILPVVEMLSKRCACIDHCLTSYGCRASTQWCLW